LVVVARVDIEARDALLAEHLQVTAVVLEGELQVEAVAAQLLHRPALELLGGRVVAVVPHDQHVPAQLVALQPGQGVGLDPQGAPGEQDPAQGRVQELEQAGHLLDQGVVAAGVEERGPVPPARLDEVLAAGRVGEDPVQVEHHGRTWTHGGIPPAPVARGAPKPILPGHVLRAQPAHSSSADAPARRLISSTTAASARVVVSPRSRPSATSRSSLRMILPLRVLGRSSVKMTVLGRAMGPILAATWARSASPRARSASWPAFRVTKAMMAWPVVASLA